MWGRFKTEIKFYIKSCLMAFCFVPLDILAASEGVPAKEIFVQVFNFSIFLGLFLFLISKPLKKLFHKRQEEFLSFEKSAAQLEGEKKKEYEEWKQKLSKLIEEEKKIKQQAQREGNKFAEQKKEELKTLQARLKREADFFIKLEKEQAKSKLLKFWKSKVIESAEKELEKQAQSAEFQKERVDDFFKQMKRHV